MRGLSVYAVVVAAAATLAPAHAAVPATTTPAPAPVVGGCQVFPADSYWNTDVSHLKTDKHSKKWLAHMHPSVSLHPDFGEEYGIPITTVDGTHPKVPVTFDYDDESDQVDYPLGADTRIEGGAGSQGDKHAIVVDTSTCQLYETWNTLETGSGWTAGSGATWSLSSSALRPRGWTSADAAGLPILPGLLRYDEVQSGEVDHAIRFTTDRTSAAYVWPARHQAGRGSSSTYPPMGARFRLKSSWKPPKSFGADALVVVRAMQHYGLVLADNGSPWFFQGEQDDRWSDQMIEDLKHIPAKQFVAVDTSKLKISTDSMQAKQPR